MPINHDEIIEEIEGHIRKFGGGFGEWCVGTGKQVSGVRCQVPGTGEQAALQQARSRAVFPAASGGRSGRRLGLSRSLYHHRRPNRGRPLAQRSGPCIRRRLCPRARQNRFRLPQDRSRPPAPCRSVYIATTCGIAASGARRACAVTLNFSSACADLKVGATKAGDAVRAAERRSALHDAVPEPGKIVFVYHQTRDRGYGAGEKVSGIRCQGPGAEPGMGVRDSGKVGAAQTAPASDHAAFPRRAA
jgi:hypothetical protein